MFETDVTRRYNDIHRDSEDQISEGSTKIGELTKERDELLALVMQRGKTIEVSCGVTMCTGGSP